MSVKNKVFVADLREFARRANLNLELVVRKAALDMLKAIIDRSPVGNPDLWGNPASAPPGYVGGRFKGNWIVQVAIAPEQSDEVDDSGSAALNRGSDEIARFKVGGTLYIMNFLPYSVELENGHSTQAPRGMIKLTALEYQQYIAGAIQSLPQR